MAHSQFQPTIDYFGAHLTVTLPVDQRRVFWDAFGDDARKIVKLTGMNRTQVAIEPLPGYSARKARVLALTALKFATYPGMHEQFWASNSSALLYVINSCARPDGEAAFNWDEIEFALRLILPDWADTMILTAHQQVSDLAYEYGLDETYNQMVQAYRRLEFADPKATFLTREEWESRLNTCQRLLGVIAAKSGEVNGLNQRISDLKKHARVIRNEFRRVAYEASQGDVSLDDLYLKYQVATADLNHLVKIHGEIIGTVDVTAATEAVSEIKLLTPPPSN